MWTEFILALLVFFASHTVPIRPPVKPWLVARLGARGFTVAYSGLSLAILVWLIGAAGRAPFVALWDWNPAQGIVAQGAMMLACVILSFTLFRPNPFSFGGWNNAAFNPDRPGITRVLRHPLLAVLALWGATHLMVNGDLAHVILFGLFTVFALLGGWVIDRRKRREMGDNWQDLVDQIAQIPVWSHRNRSLGALGRVGLSALLFAALIYLHPIVIGVDPLPW